MLGDEKFLMLSVSGRSFSDSKFSRSLYSPRCVTPIFSLDVLSLLLDSANANLLLYCVVERLFLFLPLFVVVVEVDIIVFLLFALLLR